MFWSLTPKETQIILGGVAARIRRERNDMAWMAWHIAALGRAKKMPKLEELLDRPARKPRKQSPEEMQAIMRSWFGVRRQGKAPLDGV